MKKISCAILMFLIAGCQPNVGTVLEKDVVYGEKQAIIGLKTDAWIGEPQYCGYFIQQVSLEDLEQININDYLWNGWRVMAKDIKTRYLLARDEQGNEEKKGYIVFVYTQEGYKLLSINEADYRTIKRGQILTTLPAEE